MSEAPETIHEAAQSKVIAVFRQPEAAELARDQVKSETGLDDDQVKVVGPKDPSWDGEPEGEGFERTAVRYHLTFALAGLSAVLVTWSVLYLVDFPVVMSTPFESLVAMALFGSAFGLLFGALLTTRLDRELMIERARVATRAGRWALVVRPLSRAQFESALAILQATGVPVAHTM